MDSTVWAKVHGATVHFPIALVACSGAVDLLGFVFPGAAQRRAMHAAGYWTLILSAAGTLPAVVSGLVMTKGVLLGHDALRRHHLVAWPAFALIVGLAVWRSLAGGPVERRPPPGYLATMGLATALVMAAGYFGGEMLLGP